MVMLSQFFGASMNVMTRLLELDGPHGQGMHPFEVCEYVAGSLQYLPIPLISRKGRWHADTEDLIDTLRSDDGNCSLQFNLYVVQ